MRSRFLGNIIRLNFINLGTKKEILKYLCQTIFLQVFQLWIWRKSCMRTMKAAWQKKQEEHDRLAEKQAEKRKQVCPIIAFNQLSSSVN